jgi:hypothetical protein
LREATEGLERSRGVDNLAGLGVLFNKLQQGIVENQQVLIVARLRADAEELYGTKLSAIPGASEKSGGFGRDDGATARQVCLCLSAADRGEIDR